MTHGNSSITFDLGGRRYEYDGALPDDVLDQATRLLDADGFWIGGYPDLAAQMKDPDDQLPAVLWEIAHVGGTVVEVQGARPNGSIHWEDWKHPRIH